MGKGSALIGVPVTFSDTRSLAILQIRNRSSVSRGVARSGGSASARRDTEIAPSSQVCWTRLPLQSLQAVKFDKLLDPVSELSAKSKVSMQMVEVCKMRWQETGDLYHIVYFDRLLNFRTCRMENGDL
jgi:hypothetical protein